ncbi:probable LRR receptor-like serine/threonine-protein kinase At1g67720 isoform X2 [Cryptomeria japonica]|uniref:probable LRR receptor-like serine/threonine-protein kinase At1g67720 isoform X2 n=1 Tax=Cryptomeria japonica TaxID=3369 RepID=UPI0027DA6086|nr:probable LRR receptor-like serine/threonine-protein kinase At1g67720 isoform X2 [Cryptomeria japonica]
MKMQKPILCLTANILVLFVSVAAQPGFLNIDCGGRKNSTDPETNMTWIVDANYVDVGQTVNFSIPNTPFHMQSMRLFPKPLNKSCYRLPVNPNVNYLLRLWFLFDYYDQSTNLPSFNVSFETEGLLTQKIQAIKSAQDIEWTSEKILRSPNGVLYVCLIRTSDDSDPFVSAIQLRSLLSGMYALQVKPGTMLSTVTRRDLGVNSTDLVRYPRDEFDRFWTTEKGVALDNNTLPILSSRSVNFNDKNNSSNVPPTFVLQSALTVKPSTEPLVFGLERQYIKTLVVLYFAEIEVLNSSEYRKFKILINNIAVSNITLDVKNNIVQVPLTYDREEQVEFSLQTIQDEQGKSNRGPLLNGLEYYKIIDSETATDAGDVSGLFSIKTAFGLKEWISDPCFSIPWNGIKCNKNYTVRVVEIDLSGRNLSGPVPNSIKELTELRSISFQDNHLSGILPDFCKLARLEILRLQNNNLSGIIPDCLSELKNLKEVNLENNNLSGVVPEGLLRNRFLDISLLDMKTATNNFSQKIGQGGFGSVYFGKLADGKDVAVKLLSSSSKQGLAEFLNEINLLSRVHHKNLVSLSGYCNESEELMLVYEHMCGGSLKDHLYGSLSNISTLDWKTRLGIALDAAQGLEYLLVSCTPKIVHRDVKSSNILLDSNLRAKMADFGLSKIIGDDIMSSHITTNIKGTVGYLDPEYFHTNKLTERSDVYSFGVVLLEMICGRKAIDPELCEEELSLLKWVMLHVEGSKDYGGPLIAIIDKKMCMSEIDMKSLYPIFTLSLKCIQNEASKRPTITDIVKQIKEAMDMIKSESSSEEINEPRYSAEYSYSLLDVGR